MTRGIKREVDEFVKWAERLTAPYPKTIKNPDGSKGETINQLYEVGLRPIQLWEMSFPEGSMSNILKTIKFDGGFYPDTLKFRMMRNALKKALGLDDVPELDKDAPKIPFNQECLKWVSVIPLGVRRDKLDHDFGAYWAEFM